MPMTASRRQGFRAASVTREVRLTPLHPTGNLTPEEKATARLVAVIASGGLRAVTDIPLLPTTS